MDEELVSHEVPTGVRSRVSSGKLTDNVPNLLSIKPSVEASMRVTATNLRCARNKSGRARARALESRASIDEIGAPAVHDPTAFNHIALDRPRSLRSISGNVILALGRPGLISPTAC